MDKIVFYKVTDNDGIFEISPPITPSSQDQMFTCTPAGEFVWKSIEENPAESLNNIINNIDSTSNKYPIKIKDGRVGIGRIPLHQYILDIAVQSNKLSTGLHIGDGNFGFSMGNGASKGFTPQIIGMGQDENDAGLYFIGRAGNDKDSDVPLIIFDGRQSDNNYINNRPIVGFGKDDIGYMVTLDNNGDVTYKYDILDGRRIRASMKESKIDLDSIDYLKLYSSDSKNYLLSVDKNIDKAIKHNIIKEDKVNVTNYIYLLLGYIKLMKAELNEIKKQIK